MFESIRIGQAFDCFDVASGAQTEGVDFVTQLAGKSEEREGL